MAKNQIRGNTQIIPLTITNSEISASAGVASTKLANWSANRNAGANKLVNLSPGSSTGEAVTYEQLVSMVTGSAHDECRMASTANVTLSGVQTIDGVTGVADDRVFVRVQTNPAENGIYEMKAGAWVRDTDGDTWDELISALIPISEGTTMADTLWLITADRGGTLGTTPIPSIQLPGANDLQGGAGLTRTGQVLDVVAADNTMTINANSIQVKLDPAGAIVVGASGISVQLLSTGGLEISSNSLKVKLDGASLTLSASGLKVTTPTPSFADKVTPTGTVNGTNTAFVLPQSPTAGSEHVYKNGQLMEVGGGNDYTISGATITFDVAPVTGDQIRVSYRY
jgi:hypothetical protein